MNPDPCPRTRSQELLDQITARIEDLAGATDAARMSEEMLRYLDTLSRFHHYSTLNTWLIMTTCPHATFVAGFHAWHKLGRFVLKGENGIPILAPILITEKSEDEAMEKTLRGFKVVYVFDVSQTDGEPLPEAPNWKSPEKNALLSERLIAYAQYHGIVVTEKVLPGEMQGVSKGGRIEVSPTAGTSTLIHEIAHELLHKGKNPPAGRSIREMEAEAVAYVVGRHFGLDGTSGPNYIALHGANSNQILEHLARIADAARAMVGAVEDGGPQQNHGTTISSTSDPRMPMAETP